MQDSPELAKQDSLLTHFDYKPDVFRKYFTTPFMQYREHIGKTFTVLDAAHAARSQLESYEHMYTIKLSSGEIIIAWGHEVCELNREATS